MLWLLYCCVFFFFFFNDTATTEIYTLSLHDALPICSGGVSGTVADPKIIFKAALDKLASGVLLVHNHPSGNLKPSHQDIQLTKKLVESGRVLEIPVLDHVIFTDESYYSFADEGLI